jgi:putative membrane protein
VTGGHVAHGGDLLGWLLPVAVLLLAVACGRAVHGRRAAGRAWSRWRTASAVAGLVALAVAVAPPVQAAAHADLRAHMAQHLLLGMFAPLLLVLSAPATLLIGALPAAGRRRVAALLRARPLHVAAHPVTAALLDVGGLHLLYLTPLYRLAHDVPAVHAAVMLHFVLAGTLFAWSIAGPGPGPRRPGTAARVAVLVAAGAAHGHLAKLLYAGAAELPPGLGAPVAEVQEAAQLVYYGGSLAELGLAIALFGGRRARAHAVRRACGASGAPRPRHPSSSTGARRASPPPPQAPPPSAPPPPPVASRSRPGPPPRSPAGR